MAEGLRHERLADADGSKNHHVAMAFEEGLESAFHSRPVRGAVYVVVGPRGTPLRAQEILKADPKVAGRS